MQKILGLTKQEIYETIMNIMIDNRWSKRALARETGMSATTVTLFLENPDKASFATLIRLAKVIKDAKAK